MNLYTEDWIGLKTLDVAGRVKFVSVVGNHLGISHEDMNKYMVPYLKSQEDKLYHYKIKDAQAFVTRTKITKSRESIMKDLSMYKCENNCVLTFCRLTWHSIYIVLILQTYD